MSVRRGIFEIIQPDHGNSLASRAFDMTITALILMSAVIVFAVTFDLPPSVLPVLKWLERAASIVFTIEYLLRILTADFLYPAKGPLWARAKYVVSPMAIIDLVAILPFCFRCSCRVQCWRCGHCGLCGYCGF